MARGPIPHEEEKPAWLDGGGPAFGGDSDETEAGVVGVGDHDDHNALSILTIPTAHKGETSACTVISGEVWCSIGQEKHELKTGDTIYFNSGQAHQMENAGAGSAKLLCVAVPVAL